jgi:tetratricopeptide (TPR) repeat protein
MTLPLPLGLLLSLLIVFPGPGWAGGSAPAPADRQPLASTAGSDSAETSEPVEIEVLRAELAKDPGNAKAQIRLGWLLLAAGSDDAAISSFDQALQVNPRSADAKTGKGAALRRKGELATAEAILKDALLHNPNPVRAHYELGLVYDCLGAPDKALAEFKAAIEKYRQGRR